MRSVYVISDNIISSLGFTTGENMKAIESGETGIRLHENDAIAPASYWASVADHQKLLQLFSAYDAPKKYTLFEQMVICSMKQATEGLPFDIHSNKTLHILSTTKGNVDLLNKRSPFHTDSQRIYLWHTARLLKQFFGFAHQPLVVSNACISGVLAISIGARLIRSGQFDHIIITGADVVSEFVLSGFNSFLSLCQGPCKPFDRDRQGLSLGEAAGTIVLTSEKSFSKDAIEVGQGYTANDANHISGPSRTGEGLFLAINRALKQTTEPVDYISAHGTATPFNDEMESIALTRAELNQVPVNSFKGFWGHTLGAAGVIETIAGIWSMKHDIAYKTLGFSNPGVSQPLDVIDQNRRLRINTFLKIASGFGGSNASLLIFR